MIWRLRNKHLHAQIYIVWTQHNETGSATFFWDFRSNDRRVPHDTAARLEMHIHHPCRS